MNTSTAQALVRQQVYLALLALVAVVLWCVFPGGKFPSMLHGTLSCWLPVLLSLRLYDRWGWRSGGLVAVGVIELVKVVLTVVALASAEKLLHPPNWLAVVAGFVFGQMLSWVSLWVAHVMVSKS